MRKFGREKIIKIGIEIKDGTMTGVFINLRVKSTDTVGELKRQLAPLLYLQDKDTKKFSLRIGRKEADDAKTLGAYIDEGYISEGSISATFKNKTDQERFNLMFLRENIKSIQKEQGGNIISLGNGGDGNNDDDSKPKAISTIYIKFYGGGIPARCIKINWKQTKISEIRQHIALEKGCMPAEVEIRYSGEECKDDQTLSDWGDYAPEAALLVTITPFVSVIKLCRLAEGISLILHLSAKEDEGFVECRLKEISENISKFIIDKCQNLLLDTPLTPFLDRNIVESRLPGISFGMILVTSEKFFPICFGEHEILLIGRGPTPNLQYKSENPHILSNCEPRKKLDGYDEIAIRNASEADAKTVVFTIKNGLFEPKEENEEGKGKGKGEDEGPPL